MIIYDYCSDCCYIFFSLLSLLVLLYHMFVMHCRFLYVIIMISGFYDQCCVSSKVLCNDVCDVFFFFTDVEFLLYLSIVFEHISLQCSFMGGHNVFGPSKRDAHQREWNVHQPISGILGATWMF